jgi:hypothetical protein
VAGSTLSSCRALPLWSCRIQLPRLLTAGAREGVVNLELPGPGTWGHPSSRLPVLRQHPCRTWMDVTAAVWARGPPRLRPVTDLQDSPAHRTHPVLPIDLPWLHIPAATRRGPCGTLRDSDKCWKPGGCELLWCAQENGTLTRNDVTRHEHGLGLCRRRGTSHHAQPFRSRSSCTPMFF